MDCNTNDSMNGPNSGDGSSSGSIRGLSPRGNTPCLHTHQQYNTTQIQLSPQPQQHSHIPSNGPGTVGGAAQHRMTSPAPSMRVPPLMSAVSPMTAPVAQVAPVPRGFDHTQNQSLSQVCRNCFGL